MSNPRWSKSRVAHWLTSLVILALVGLSVATQSLNTQDWIKYWDVQKGFWWQLTWRVFIPTWTH